MSLTTNCGQVSGRVSQEDGGAGAVQGQGAGQTSGQEILSTTGVFVSLCIINKLSTTQILPFLCVSKCIS